MSSGKALFSLCFIFLLSLTKKLDSVISTVPADCYILLHNMIVRNGKFPAVSVNKDVSYQRLQPSNLSCSALKELRKERIPDM